MHSNNTIHKDKLFYSLILLMISPVVAMFTSILNFSFREARWILVLFFGIFGMTMIILDGKDAKVHADFFISSYVDKDLETFIGETKNIILLQPLENEGRTNDDLYIHIMSFFVGKFSSNPALLFFVVSIIYGFFYIRGVGLVYDLMKGRWNFALFLIFFLFIFWKSLEGINSIRNWTGAWIFFNGAFSYFQTREKKFLLLVLLAPMIHFAYLLIALPFYVILIFGNRPLLYFLILVFSFFITVENVDIIQEYMQMTELGSQKVGYIKEGSSEDFLIDKAAKTTFYAKYYLAAGKLVVTVLFFYALLFFGYLKKEGHNYLLMSLASMGILMIAFSNVVSFSVTINNRIFTNGAFYAFGYMLILYNKKINEQNNISLFGFDIISYMSIPLILLFTYTQLSHIGDFTDAKIFISPVVYWIFDGDYSLKELLRELFL